MEQTCQSLPFGDALSCIAPGLSPYFSTTQYPTEHHFTGKERDAESGNDYFMARYYSSMMGRFMSPDTDSSLKRIIPNPQHWNRYAYVLNNPLIMIDPDGLLEIYVFMPESKSYGSDWKKVMADAKAHENHVHMIVGKSATRQEFLNRLNEADAAIVFIGHSIDYAVQGDNARKLGGSMSFFGYEAVGRAGAPKNGLGGEVAEHTWPPSAISAQSVASFACMSNDLRSQYNSTNFTGLSGDVIPEVAEAGGLAYTKALANDGTVADADKAARKSMKSEQATWIGKDYPTLPTVTNNGHD
jgi:RHS repeat-associated protein